MATDDMEEGKGRNQPRSSDQRWLFLGHVSCSAGEGCQALRSLVVFRQLFYHSSWRIPFGGHHPDLILFITSDHLVHHFRPSPEARITCFVGIQPDSLSRRWQFTSARSPATFSSMSPFTAPRTFLSPRKLFYHSSWKIPFKDVGQCCSLSRPLLVHHFRLSPEAHITYFVEYYLTAFNEGFILHQQEALQSSHQCHLSLLVGHSYAQGIFSIIHLGGSLLVVTIQTSSCSSLQAILFITSGLPQRPASPALWNTT